MIGRLGFVKDVAPLHYIIVKRLKAAGKVTYACVQNLRTGEICFYIDIFVFYDKTEKIYNCVKI